MSRMNQGGADEEGVIMMRKAEIDTSAPFRSVQEAVLLFGERILAGEVYANKLKEMHDGSIENGHAPSRLGNITAELEETKQSLQKAQAESLVMATCLSSLQEELQRTKRELQHLKERESQKRAIELEIEDLKFVEDIKDEEEFQVKITETMIHQQQNVEFQKKRYVKFADPPSLAQVVPPADALLQRHPSLRKSKKKPLLPLIKGIFRKIGSSGVGPAGA
ncbi:WEB family protein At1g75720 [Coffea arabica]|uniref:WEB family protein At1g75720 n=1 Tax=Coffea arabica TaxID=13443 RepID=A0A6P6UHT3_COFAR|nr:WEB family protein At1g75720-like [Coffea arabica]